MPVMKMILCCIRLGPLLASPALCTNACTAHLPVKRPLRICVQGSGTSCNSHQSHTDGAEQFFGYAQFDSYSFSFPDKDDSDTYRVQLVPLLDIINHADEPNVALSKDHLASSYVARALRPIRCAAWRNTGCIPRQYLAWSHTVTCA